MEWKWQSMSFEHSAFCMLPMPFDVLWLEACTGGGTTEAPPYRFHLVGDNSCPTKVANVCHFCLQRREKHSTASSRIFAILLQDKLHCESYFCMNMVGQRSVSSLHTIYKQSWSTVCQWDQMVRFWIARLNNVHAVWCCCSTQDGAVRFGRDWTLRLSQLGLELLLCFL